MVALARTTDLVFGLEYFKALGPFWISLVELYAPESGTNDPETILRTVGTNTQARGQILRKYFALATRTCVQSVVPHLK